ncbi:hypothetical protein HanHA300_Chr07g0243271 [Helianthus annuus]|nr:hypothetical protein HanHA300_Chr07g0243271 [Helianthus annuus]KAJ0563208.1 hypothetical protein HanHA89_Chr07g0260481 [Helianthus annuus]KAJ0728570.1 hypothetical protein HanLR1_Chr07g0243131 [Helianthus annuus]KAJ0731318.1 hypothetical protein HanOQP8_Chr07g0250571 [Helianthus annuus]
MSTLIFITFTSSPSTKSMTILATSSLPTTFFVGNTSGLTATFSSSVNMAAFIFCSAYNGHAIIGTPFVTLSNVEFHPQCVKNPATDVWFKISTCGAHDDTTSPTFWVRVKNPSGR